MFLVLLEARLRWLGRTAPGILFSASVSPFNFSSSFGSITVPLRAVMPTTTV